MADPVACTLSGPQMSDRLVKFRELAARSLLGRTRAEGWVRLDFERSEATEAQVNDLIRREKECCPFLEFQIDDVAGRLSVTIVSPPEGQAVLDALYETTGPEQPGGG
jgi:hypothetical protein